MNADHLIAVAGIVSSVASVVISGLVLAFVSSFDNRLGRIEAALFDRPLQRSNRS